MTDFASAPHAPLSDRIEDVSRCARAIDGAFNGVAEQLGEGLSLFGGLKSRFADLSRELAGDDMDQTRARLAGLARELRDFGAALPAETEMLLAMSKTDTQASGVFAQLREHLQLVAVLARSTRIEAASLSFYRDDIGSFTERIIALTGQAKDTIDESLRAYGRLTELLGKALDHQREFSERYRASLETVARRLDHSVSVLQERAARSVGFTADAAERAENLSAAVGNAIVSMQAGDNIRQRLEHVASALGLVAADSADPASQPLGFVIRRLGRRQLSSAYGLLRQEIEGIDATLALLESDSQGMMDLGRKLHSSDGERTDSFLHHLQADLAEASSLIEKCDGARSVVNRATQALIGMVDRFQQTEAGLAETIEDIVMIGTNAGLLAGRLGVSGRGLVVIASEVKAVASLIVRDAALLRPLFEALQAASNNLRTRDRGGDTNMASLDRSIREALERMRASGGRLDAALAGLAEGAGKFGRLVADCRTEFAEVSQTCEAIDAAADQLGAETAAAGLPATADAAGLARILSERVYASYTMVDERDIHRRTLAELGLAHEAVEPRRFAAG